MKKHNMAVFDGRNTYKNVRLLRALAVMLQKRFADTPAAWEVWRGMSAHVSEVAQRQGVWASTDALKFRDALRLKLRMPHYGFSGMVCFMCHIRDDHEETED